MKLIPELVPKPLWRHNAQRLLGESSRKAIRKGALEAAKHSCEKCGLTPSPLDSEPLSCHEQWQYDDKKRIATLVGFEMHCTDCDFVTHTGRAMRHGFGDRALKQMSKVNGVSLQTAQDLFLEAMALWRTRSKENKKKWSVRVDTKLIKACPKLAILETSSLSST